MSSENKYFSGVSEAQAAMKAARFFGLEPDEIAYERVEKRHGFVRARRNVIISVSLSSPRRVKEERPEPPAAKVRAVEVSEAVEADQNAEAVEAGETTEASEADPTLDPPEVVEDVSEPGEPVEVAEAPERDESAEATPERAREAAAEPAAPEGDVKDFEVPTLEPVDPELEDTVWDALEPLLRLADLEIEAEIGERGGELTVELEGPDADRVVARHGEVLDALGQLLPRLLREVMGERVSCRIDCAGFWLDRELELQRLAHREAREALRRERSRTLPPMNPRERRVVHQAVTGIEGVTTESRGEGRRKRVVIRPS